MNEKYVFALGVAGTIIGLIAALGIGMHAQHKKVQAEPVDEGYEQITKYTYRVVDRELGNVCYRTAVSSGAISCVPMGAK